MHFLSTLNSQVGFPLVLGPKASRGIALPEPVSIHLKKSSLWHLVAWSDEFSGTSGLWHKGLAILFPRNKIERLSIEVSRTARGHGWVAMEAKMRDQPAISLLEAIPFNPDAFTWLDEKKYTFSQAFTCDISIKDLGFDY